MCEDPSIPAALRPQSYNTALVVLSALSCGPDVVRLAGFTGLPQDFVANIRARMDCFLARRADCRRLGCATMGWRGGPLSLHCRRACSQQQRGRKSKL